MPPHGHAFIYSAALEEGGYPASCPFNTHRPGMTFEKVRAMNLLDGEDRFTVAPARLSRSELETFHTPAYLDALEGAGRGDLAPYEALQFGLGTPDCPIFRDMYAYACLTAGGALTGARLILNREAAVAFSPSGGFHHAAPGNAAGFCYLNDIVIAALELAAAGRRVLFIDLDVHHGDGVQDAFYRSAGVMTISLHESPETLFPGTGRETEIGEGPGRGYTVNVPLPVGTYDEAYERVFRSVAEPLARAYDPDVIMLELGMDGLAGDPLAHLHLTNNVYADLTARIRALGKPLLVTGGGGYHVENTVRGWALCWSVLCGEDVTEDLAIGMGGVMLENTEWLGGLRDRRVLLSDAGRRGDVDAALDRVAGFIHETVFPVHGLGPGQSQ